jgi:hypothetical protein
MTVSPRLRRTGQRYGPVCRLDIGLRMGSSWVKLRVVTREAERRDSMAADRQSGVSVRAFPRVTALKMVGRFYTLSPHLFGFGTRKNKARPIATPNNGVPIAVAIGPIARWMAIDKNVTITNDIEGYESRNDCG